MLYPEHYICLSDSEMEYTYGGKEDSAAAMICAVAGVCLSVVNALQVISIKKDLEAQYPEKNSFELIQQAHMTHMTEPSGILMEVASVGLLLGVLFA